MEIIFSRDRAAASPFGLWTKTVKSCRMCGVGRASTSAIFTCYHSSSIIIFSEIYVYTDTQWQPLAYRETVLVLKLTMTVEIIL